MLGQLVGRFVVAAIKEVFAVLVYDFNAKSVKSMNRNLVGVFADNFTQAFAHVGGGIFGKG